MNSQLLLIFLGVSLLGLFAVSNYQSESDMLFVHINWNQSGAIYLISKDTQNKILKKHGKDFYFKLPKQGTNPRGVEITGKAINELIGHSATKSIKIIWKRDEIKLYDPYDKWIELWKDDVIWTSKLST